MFLWTPGHMCMLRKHLQKFLKGWSMGVWTLCVDTICFGKMYLGILCRTAACCLVNDAFLLKRWYHLRRTDLCRYKSGQGNHGKCQFSDRPNLWHENLRRIQNTSMYKLILCLSFEHHDFLYWNFAVHCHSVQGKWFLWHFLIQWIPWNRWMRLWHKRCRILCRWWVKRMENPKRTLSHVCFRFITLYFLAFPCPIKERRLWSFGDASEQSMWRVVKAIRCHPWEFWL